MNSTLVRGHRIETSGFSSFTVINRAPRPSRNPHSATAVNILKRRVPHFKVGKAQRDAVNLPVRDVDQDQPK